AEFHGQPHVLGHPQAEAAVLGRQREPEQAHVGRLLAQDRGDGVRLLDLVLARDHLVADEGTYGPQDLGQLVGVHARIVTSAAAETSGRHPGRMGGVRTVTGEVEPERIGWVLSHEHLLTLAVGPWHDPVETAVAAVRAAGVDTVVDLSPYGDAG